ncbi:MAG: NAD(P)H-dependent glycerol-3-phosphate dehydrogenase [Gemmatimonadetes bacterium]|nr:NAD(P)H-dependent glycerol-3-phosphate dehydrogenase [Gemmatimonadota bacterium]
MRIAVLGAGSWGTTLADLLARKGEDVRLWAYEAEVVEAVNASHLNPVFLPGSPLAPSLRAVGDAAEAVKGASIVVSVAPSHALRSVLRRVQEAVPSGTIIVSATKGLESDTLALMSDVIAAELPQARLAVLSGPSFAREVYERRPTAVVASSASPEVAEAVQAAFSTPRFRVYSNTDVVGVELGGALKNVIAIAAGVLDGLDLGNNARAALLTRGLAEITRLGVAHGADPLTFAGLAGMGDLILTATGDLSRNRQLGLALAKGETYEAYRARHRTVAEGANAARAAAALGQKLGVELPISSEVAAILFEGQSPAEATRNLMERTLKAEQWR